jgi:hypothetical protein
MLVKSASPPCGEEDRGLLVEISHGSVRFLRWWGTEENHGWELKRAEATQRTEEKRIEEEEEEEEGVDGDGS